MRYKSLVDIRVIIEIDAHSEEMVNSEKSYHAPHLDSEEEEEEEGDEVADLDTLLAMKKEQNKVTTKNRASVSAESYGIFNKRENFTARVIGKTEEQYQKIKDKLMQSFLFKSLDEKELDTCIKAMEIKNYKYIDLI